MPLPQCINILGTKTNFTGILNIQLQGNSLSYKNHPSLFFCDFSRSLLPSFFINTKILRSFLFSLYMPHSYLFDQRKCEWLGMASHLSITQTILGPNCLRKRSIFEQFSKKMCLIRLTYINLNMTLEMISKSAWFQLSVFRLNP